ncbi:MAG: hydrogenase maturation nickel metallochaperone HypA/HybF, partial [Eubacteriales bacterium]
DLTVQRVTKVILVVGEMTNAMPDALEAVFTVFAHGTKVEGAELQIRMIPLTARCTECEWEGSIERHVFICPHCSSLGLEIKSGRELYVESLEVE